MITHRTTADIAIKRGNATIATVLITERSVRRFTLMQEDSITLAFDLADPVEFKVGDYFIDEIFGKFVITQKQMPAYNTSNGAYQYSLKFEAAYRRWAAYKFMLTEVKDNVRYRKESVWTLTAALATHADEVKNNLAVLGVTAVVFIPQSFTQASEVRFVDYNAVDIITALSQMAEAYECEWWVKEASGTYTIHFGKCEIDDENPPKLTLGGTFGNEVLAPNCDSIEMSQDQQTYANRLYPFGGSRNVPDTYDRELKFTATECWDIEDTNQNTITVFRDRNRSMKPAYILGESSNLNRECGLYSPSADNTTAVTIGTDVFYKKYDCNGIPANIGRVSEYSIEGSLTISGKTNFVDDDQYSDQYFFLSIELKATQPNAAEDIVLYTTTIRVDREENVTEYDFSVIADVDTTKGLLMENINPSLTIKTIASSGGEGGYFLEAPTVTANLRNLATFLAIKFGGSSKTCTLRWGELTHAVRLNPKFEDAGGAYYNWFSFIDDQGGNIQKPPSFANFGEDSEYELEGLSVTVPLSYWSRIDTDNPSSIAKLGEKRLHMDASEPDNDAGYVKGNGYIELPDLDASEVVEEVIALDEVYPRCTLKITEVTATQKREKVENRDGSTVWWDWVQYSFKVAMLDGTAFVFNDDYLLDNSTLQCKFLTKEEAQAEISGYNAGTHYLSGMTFDLAFSQNYPSQTYTIVRNEDYGAKLPNETLRPNVGDVLVLLGWNVNAMSSLGLVGKAEEELESKAVEYLQAINDDQFTFTCKMMSDYPFTLAGNLPFDVQPSDEEQIEVEDFYDDNDDRFYVRNGNRAYNLLLEGTKVTIKHHALKNGTKTSRVIGYEFKLDKPFDTPTYVIGETEAFSRLKKLEKEITKLGG